MFGQYHAPDTKPGRRKRRPTEPASGPASCHSATEGHRSEPSVDGVAQTWDISKLALVTQGVYLSLYAVTDLLSRYTVAWMISLKENSAFATQLMHEAGARYRIELEQLTLHQDRGSPMTANGFLGAMRALDITCSHSRSRVSNDNPISESSFKTLKYQPEYPGKFNNPHHARQWCHDYYQWANFHHHHRGLNGYTPEQVFTGSYEQVALTKQAALDKRFSMNPDRFVKGRPVVKIPPSEVAINPISAEEIAEGIVDAVNFPTLRAAGYQANAI